MPCLPRWRVLPLLCLMLCLLAAPAAGEDRRLNRSGYVCVTMNPILYESNLYQTSYMVSLDQLFRTATEDLAEDLAEALEKTALRGRLRVVPGYRLAEQKEFRERGEPDTFLITVDLRSSYGLSKGSSFASCLAPASCFLLSSINMLTFNSRTEAEVHATYFSADGRGLRLVQTQYKTRGSVSGDFFDAMEMPREFEWITLLTYQALDDLKRTILDELPPALVQRAWAKAGEELGRPPLGGKPGLPPAPVLSGEEPAEAAEANEALAIENGGPPEGETLSLPELVRRSSHAIFKIRTPQATGSGFVISRHGYGVTSLHVVEGAEKITLHFHNGPERQARVVASEPKLDLAILAFEGGGLSPLPLGDSARVATGEPLVGIGYPRENGLTVMPGVVNSLEPYQETPLIHLDATLPPGSSGGPLLNQKGEAVGITFRRTRGMTEGTVLGLPINAARRVFEPFLDPS